MQLKGDFLQILLEDETTRNNDELIIDECLTFFFAGTQTSNLTSQNLVYMLVKHPHYYEQVLHEIDTVIVQPYLHEQVEAGSMEAGTNFKGINILELMNFENTGDMTFYGYCFNESLRMQPPVFNSSANRVTKECTNGGLTIRPDSMFSIDMWRLGNNEQEWIEPE